MSNPFIKKRTTLNEIFNNDPERLETYNKIVELLITAGYFRARLQNLVPFDKILGGMAWTLTGCFYDIDIDFKDEMTLTEKIRVSEKITAGLKSINYPNVLNPIQIQGLDLKPIYTCLQWLYKRLLETRDERNEMNKKFSINFLKNSLLEDNKSKSKNITDDENILKAKYNKIQQNRKYKPKQKLNFDYNDELRVFFTMIEFGQNKSISFQRQLIELLKKKNLIDNSKIKESSKNTGPTIPDSKENNKLSKEELNAINEIVNNNIEEISDNNLKQKVNTSIIEAIFSENMDIISKEIDSFDNSKGDEGIDKIKLYAKEKERLEKNKINIEQQIENYSNELNEIQTLDNNELEEIQKIKDKIENLRLTQEQNLQNKEKIIQKVKEEKLSEEKLEFLSEKNKQKEELKNMISKFKKDCMAEKKIYDVKLENYKNKIDKLNSTENEAVFNEIDVNYNEEMNKNLQRKKDLFEQNKVINRLTRKIQLYPSKLEIIQYQKRFQELYDQINTVSEKSKKILGEYNSKNEVISLLAQKQEVFIDLKTMYRNIKKKHEKEDFKITLNNVYNTLVESLTKSGNKINEMNKDIDNNNKTLNDLRLYESNYMKLIKEYNKEYNKYNLMKNN
jgi:hypothetical protein